MVDQTSQFYAILTAAGAAKQANADALGVAWTITHMAVGDGNPGAVENPPLPMPDASWRAMLNEWRRAPLNQLKVDEKDSSIIVAEQVIPADVGGRWIREIALFDADGDMVAVANCAPTYKPLLSQGSGRTQVVRMNLIVSSSSNVQLKIDPSVVLATREWVTEELAKQDFKHSVLVATTANIVLSGLQTVDGVSVPAGARVLVKNQAAAKDNGLYLVVAGGPWTRCTDADTSAKVTPGLLVQVEKGAVNADSGWQLVTDAPITLGVSALAFELAFGRTGVAAGTYRSVTVDVYGRVVAATNPTTVAGYGLTDVYTMTQVNNLLAAKANLASPALTGAPTAPTAGAGSSTLQLANTAFVQAAIAALVASSPAALDTLNELAAALGNDPNFATTITNLLSLKAPLASPALSGVPTSPTAGAGSSNMQVANTAFVAKAVGDTLPVFNTTDAVTDWNTITTAGWFPNILAASTANSPGAKASYYYCQVLRYSVNVTQIAYPYGAGSVQGAMFYRSLYQDVWTDWVELASIKSPTFTGTPKAPTPAQFDASTLVATMEAVQRALGNASDFEELSADRVIVAADAGKTFLLAAPSVSITFPNSTTLPKGFEVTILSAGSTSCTLVGSSFVSSRGAVVTGTDAFSLKIHARKNSNQYRVSHWGDGIASLSANGFAKLVNGVVIQWGLANSSTSGVATTLPIAFPNAGLRAVVTPVNSPVGVSQVLTDKTITVTSASGIPGCNYIAIGY